VDFQGPVEHHTVVVGVSAVTVGIPVFLPDVQLNVTANKTNAFNFQQGVSKIRTSSHPGTTRIDHSDPPTRFRPQCREAGCPFFPKLGQQPFRYSATTVFGNLTQRGCHRPQVRLRFYRWQENCASARITLNCYKNPTRGLDVDYP
jgi:hypothetical protein